MRGSISFLSMCVVSLAVTLLPASRAGAVPSFARQTGWSCAMCHTVFPELTPMGRRFKLEGYATEEMRNPKPGAIEVSAGAPVAAMILADDAFIKTQPPAVSADEGTDHRGTAKFPDQLSLFYAGPIASNLGAFAQLTYTPDTGSIGMDMLDLRYVTKTDCFGYDLTLGVDANNNPTCQDAWNTGPAWGFPFAVSSVTPAPGAESNLAALAGSVASLGAYAFFNDMVYAEFSGYRSAPQGAVAPGDFEAIQRFAPYWRIAVQQEWDRLSAEVGTYGMQVSSYPNGVAGPTGPMDHVRDLAFDAQVQYIGDDHILSARANLIREKSLPDATFALGMTGNSANQLRTGSISGTYTWKRLLSLTVGYTALAGSNDQVLYAGNVSNTPDTAGMTYEVDYLPWRNTKFAAQYTAYSTFNGASSNYDGTDRNAKDNDTLALIAQLMF